MAMTRNSNEPTIEDEEDVEGHARGFQSNEPVTEDEVEDTEGHGRYLNSNESVDED